MTLVRNLAVAIAVTLALKGAVALHAQAPSTDRFDVASVRRVEIAAVSAGLPVFPRVGGIGTADPRRIAIRGEWLFGLIAEAFGVRSDQISGLESVSNERYDIVANIPEGATKAQFNAMLGNLLRDRFGLRFHLESKPHAVYALRVAKSGPKIKPAAPRADNVTAAGSIGADARGCPTVPANYKGMVGRPGPGEMCWTAGDIPLKDLARLLEDTAGRPIVDETGLTGGYDFTIQFARGGHRPGTPAPDVAVSSAPSVFAAVEEQLGLKLEPATASFDQLIIDSISREPTEN